MQPSLFITSDIAPVVETLAVQALACGFALGDTDAPWHLHLPRSGVISLTCGDHIAYSQPAPRRLADIAQALDSALQQWQQRPLPLGAGWELLPVRRLCTHPGHAPVELTDKESALLAMLLKAGGAPIDRETLLSRIWAYESGVDSHTLETHIYRLRGKCEQLTGLTLDIRADMAGYSLQGGA